MRDPIVEALQYALKVDEASPHDFASAAPTELRLGLFDCRLVDGGLSATPTAFFADEESARAALEPYLRAWEAHAEIVDPNDLRFEFSFVRSEVIDRDPPPPEVLPDGTSAISMSGGAVSRMSASGSFEIGHSRYPDAPPEGFVVSPAVESLRARLRSVRTHPWTLTATAYYAKTALEDLAGGRPHAAEHFAISTNVLDTLGRLASKFDPAHGRKFNEKADPLTSAELEWLRQALRAVIVRVGEVQGGATGLDQITLAALPPLP